MTEYRVFMDVVDLYEGETIEIPDGAIPLTVEERGGHRGSMQVRVWYLGPAEADR